jgi:DNA polymerase-3 subunit gamma/tau
LTAAVDRIGNCTRCRTFSEEAVQDDPFVRSMIDTFGARVVPGSVRPLDPQ